MDWPKPKESISSLSFLDAYTALPLKVLARQPAQPLVPARAHDRYNMQSPKNWLIAILNERCPLLIARQHRPAMPVPPHRGRRNALHLLPQQSNSGLLHHLHVGVLLHKLRVPQQSPRSCPTCALSIVLALTQHPRDHPPGNATQQVYPLALPPRVYGISLLFLSVKCVRDNGPKASTHNFRAAYTSTRPRHCPEHPAQSREQCPVESSLPAIPVTSSLLMSPYTRNQPQEEIQGQSRASTLTGAAAPLWLRAKAFLLPDTSIHIDPG